MGLNEKEIEDFIEFWIPFMERNPYNKFSFQTTEYIENAKLTVYPEPDSILRIYMVFQPLEEFAVVIEQPLTSCFECNYDNCEVEGNNFTNRGRCNLGLSAEDIERFVLPYCRKERFNEMKKGGVEIYERSNKTKEIFEKGKRYFKSYCSI